MLKKERNSFLALADFLFNIALISRCLNDQIQHNGEILCRSLAFISHLAEFLSASFTAQFTAQRFIAVRFPLSVFVEKKIHLLHYLFVVFFLIFGSIFNFLLVKNNQYDHCQEELELSWFISDAILSFLLPFTIIIVLNLLIVTQLKRSFSANPTIRFRRSNSEDKILFQLKKIDTNSYEISSVKRFQNSHSENTSIINFSVS